MQTYNVRLESDVSKSYRCKRAADSLDIDAEKKSIHELSISCDLAKAKNMVLIVGASGSGKTTLAKQIFGQECFKTYLDLSKPVIEQFPEEWEYDRCAEALMGIGLTAVPCWIKPAHTLSNGQRARAEAALAMASSDSIVIDEWTSVVDRTVAKVMSHCIQKYARRSQKKIILCSCHYDVIEWLDPDLIIDCNKQVAIDRGSLRPDERMRKERLKFEIKRVDRKTWKSFSKYHYLSDTLPAGKSFYFGLFHGREQIGFQCFANYVPKKPGAKMKMHSNRTVIHPDYAGLGMGLKLIDSTSQIMKDEGFDVWAKFSSTPVFKAMSKSKCWVLKKTTRPIGNKIQLIGGSIRKTIRSNVKTFSFRFIGHPPGEFESKYLSQGLE